MLTCSCNEVEAVLLQGDLEAGLGDLWGGGLYCPLDIWTPGSSRDRPTRAPCRAHHPHHRIEGEGPTGMGKVCQALKAAIPWTLILNPSPPTAFPPAPYDCPLHLGSSLACLWLQRAPPHSLPAPQSHSFIQNLTQASQGSYQLQPDPNIEDLSP